MDTKLKMSVIMAAVDKITAPIKKVTNGTAKLTDSMKSTKAELDKISNQQEDIEHFRSLKRQINKLRPEVIRQEQALNKLNAEFEESKNVTNTLRTQLLTTKSSLSQLSNEVDLADSQVFKLRNELSKVEKPTKAMKDELLAAERSAKKLRREFKLTESTTNKLAREIVKSEKVTANLSNEISKGSLNLKNYRSEITRNQKSLKVVIDKLASAGIKTNRLAEHTKRLQQRTDKYNASLDKTKTKLKDLARHEERVKAAQEKRVKSMQLASNMAISGAGMTYASQQTIQGIKAPLQVAADFEAQMSKVQAISKANEQQIKSLSGQARQLGAETTFSASEVASAQEFLAVAGFNTNKILAATPATLKLAQAGNVDLARAADIASDALTAFNMEADEMGRMADVLALTSTTANTNVNMLGDALKTSAGVAGSFGATVEQVSAMLGIMANSGIKASQAGTAISSMYSRIAAPPKEGQEALEQLGVNAFDAEGKLRALPNIIQDISDATSDMSDTETAPLFKAIFGAEAGIMAGSKALMQAASNNKLGEYVKQLESSQGTAGNVAAKMTDNLQGTIKGWDSAMESMKISAGTALIPTIRELTVWVTGLTRKVDKFAQENPNMIKWLGIAAIAFAAITAVLGPLMIMISAVVGSYATLNFALAAASAASAKFNIIAGLGSGIMKALAAAQWLVNAAMTANPIGLVVVAVAGLIALAAMLVDDWGAVGQWFLDLWEGIKNGIGKAVDFIKGYFEALFSPIETLKKGFGMISGWFSSDDEKTVDVKQRVKQINEAVPAADEVTKVTKKNAVAPALATALTASTLPAVANSDLQVVPANPLTQHESKQVQVEGDTIAINITPTPGMDNQAIAALVRQELEKHQAEKQRKLRGMLND